VHKRCLAGRRCELSLARKARAATNARDFEIGDKAAKVSNNDDFRDPSYWRARAKAVRTEADQLDDVVAKAQMIDRAGRVRREGKTCGGRCPQEFPPSTTKAIQRSRKRRARLTLRP